MLIFQNNCKTMLDNSIWGRRRVKYPKFNQNDSKLLCSVFFCIFRMFELLWGFPYFWRDSQMSEVHLKNIFWSKFEESRRILWLEISHKQYFVLCHCFFFVFFLFFCIFDLSRGIPFFLGRLPVIWDLFNFFSKAKFLSISRKVLFRKSSLTYLCITIVACKHLGVFLQCT